MKSSFDTDEIESRLREEALALHEVNARPAPVAELMAEGRRRSRRRNAAWAGCGVAAILVGIWGSSVIRGLSPARPVASSKAETTAGPTPLIRRQASHSADRPGKLAPGSVGRAAAPPADAPIAIPVFITRRDGDEYRVIGAGIYRPPRTKELRLSDLPPGQRHAVARVLGIDENRTLGEPI